MQVRIANAGSLDGELVAGPFGPARRILTLPVAEILAQYRKKCGADISHCFSNIATVDLNECQVTGYRFWRPQSIAADEKAYRILSAAWKKYYRHDRWEYKFVRKALRRADNVLEIGCGRGFFLKSIESRVAGAKGLEFNQEAIANKATKFEILPMTVEEYAARFPASMDAVCSFQVLEHVTDPRSFLEAAIACLKPGGRLFLSTPNMESAMLLNREDAFDLPPHHMGQFSKDVYVALAKLFGLELKQVRIEHRRSAAADTVTDATGQSLLFRAMRALNHVMMDMVFWILSEPGNNILVTLQKPERQ